MSRRKSRAKKTPPKPVVSKQAALMVSRFVLWMVILGASGYGLYWLDANGLGTQAYASTQQYPARLVWQSAPAWLTSSSYACAPHAHILAEIEAGIELAPNADTNWPGLCEFVYERASASPWIASVHRVGKQANNAVLIDATFRRPFTYVLSDKLAYQVDELGVVVRGGTPIAYLKQDQLLSRLPVINARQKPAGLGSTWLGADLKAGLRLVRALSDAEQQAPLPYRSLLRAVDVGQYSDMAAGPLLIQTTDPKLTIIWGKTPGEEYASEATAAQKLAHLADLHGQYRGLPADMRYIELRYPDGPRMRDHLR
jgi:hypothetical protein